MVLDEDSVVGLNKPVILVVLDSLCHVAITGLALGEQTHPVASLRTRHGL